MADRTTVQVEPKSTRRDEIIQTATGLFAEQNYHAVGMRAIADAVGIRSSSLYHHFPSKDDLLAAITSEYTQAFIATHLPILEGDEAADARLRTVLRDQIVYFWEHRLERMVGLRELGTLSKVRPEMYAEVRDDLRRYQHAIDRAIAEGAEAGLFDAENPKLAGLAITGLVTSINDWFNPGGDQTIEEVAEYFSGMAIDRILLASR